jgi:hypothetical protein
MKKRFHAKAQRRKGEESMKSLSLSGPWSCFRLVADVLTVRPRSVGSAVRTADPIIFDLFFFASLRLCVK